MSLLAYAAVVFLFFDLIVTFYEESKSLPTGQALSLVLSGLLPLARMEDFWQQPVGIELFVSGMRQPERMYPLFSRAARIDNLAESHLSNT